MMRPAYVWTIIIVAEFVTATRAQVLEVASIKPHPAQDACFETSVLPGGRLEVSCYTLELIIREALNILPGQLTGGPKWAKQDRWDIAAKPINANTKSDERVYREMLRAIAMERFHVKLRSETRQAKGLVLTVTHHGKLGPALRPNTGAQHTFEVKPGPSLSARNVSMGELAQWLKWPAGAGRTVEDRTGLSGTYDFVLKWTPLNAEQITDPAISRDAPAIFTALREQLGLRIRAGKVHERFYVIEEAQRPDPN